MIAVVVKVNFAVALHQGFLNRPTSGDIFGFFTTEGDESSWNLVDRDRTAAEYPTECRT